MPWTHHGEFYLNSKVLFSLTTEEAALVETPSITLDLFSVVHRPVAGTTFVSSTPVWHDK